METSLTKLLKEKTRGMIIIAPDVTVRAAAKSMRDAKIGALLIMSDDQLVGILTERDMLNKVVAAGCDPDVVKVSEVMTRDVIVIDPSCSVRDAMKIVTVKRLRHLPVVRDGKLLGMVSSGDLTRSIVAEEEYVIETLNDYIRGSYPG